MTETVSDHDRLAIYRWAIEYNAHSFAVAKRLSVLETQRCDGDWEGDEIRRRG